MVYEIVKNYGYLFLGIILSLASTAIIGVFSSLQKKELSGDVIAHATLPGVTLAFIMTGVKSTVYFTIGSFISGMIAIFLIDYLPEKTNLKKDTVMALTISILFGLGLLLLSYIQHRGNSEQAGLSNWLLGDASSLMDSDVKRFFFLTFLLFTILFFCFKQWQLLCFDKAFAQAIGLPVRWLQLLFYSLTVFAIILGIQTVGIILITAILVIPVTAARFWSHRLPYMLAIAAFLASLAGVIGILLSSSYTYLPVGPCIVLAITFLGLFSFFFAPQRGLIARKWAHFQYRKRVFRENILKLFYQINKEKHVPYDTPLYLDTLITTRAMPRTKVRRYIKELCRKRLIEKRGKDCWQLTLTGKEKGKRILNRHLLWEAYLQKYLNIQSSHVHDDAEAIEHLITPEIEGLLREALKKTS